LSSVNYIFGNILLNASDITFLSNRFRRETGLSYIPEDRTEVGSALKASVAENILIGYLDNSQIVRNGIISETQLTIFCQKLVAKYQVKTSDIHEAAANLSGGNLQKLIISREMNHSSKLLIAEQPTRGVDIGGIEFIHKNILEQRPQRNGVLLVSTELSEILALSDRILVFYEGKIIGEVNRDQADENKIGMMMAGVIPQNS
jgi:simple sugar transport system ATP-binding protein